MNLEENLIYMQIYTQISSFGSAKFGYATKSWWVIDLTELQESNAFIYIYDRK